MQSSKLPRYMIRALLFIAVAIAAELLIFNFRTYESLTFSKVNSLAITDGSGAPLTVGQTVETDGNGAICILLEEIDQTADNLYLDIASAEDPTSPLTVVLSARDEGNNQYYNLPALQIEPAKESSRYIRLNLSGKAKSLKITVRDITGDSLHIGDIGLNRYRPLQFSVTRLLILLLIVCGLYALRPGSQIYRIPYSPKELVQRVAIIGVLVLQMGVAVEVACQDPNDLDPPWQHHYQYHDLAVAISEGHFHLNAEPSEQLIAMENPYDSNQRGAEKVAYLWDTAYYNGKYYSYFGVLPALVYYLPYYLMTGEAFPTYIGILLNTAAILVGVWALLHIIVRRYYPKTSAGVFLILECLLLLGCGFLTIVDSPSFYTMPKSMALALTIWGLYCWFRAMGDTSHDGTETGALRNRWLAIGALLMALVSACRPQMLVGSFLLIPLFWRPVKSRLTATPRRTGELLKNLLSVAIPYVLVAACVMYYNAARFGSPFDFGANYNLTTNDMTHRGFHLDRLPFGLFTYLLQPPVLIGKFPFLSTVRVATDYQGTTIWEGMYGGFLWFHLISAAWLFFGNVKDVLKRNGFRAFCLLSLILGLVVVCADIEMAGILSQYLCDFAVFLTLPSIILVLSGFDKLSTDPELEQGPTAVVSTAKLLTKSLLAIFLFTIVLHALWMLATNS